MINRAPWLLTALLLLVPAAPATAGVDRDDIDHVEDLTEDLQNSLHDLSFNILKGDLESFGAFFAEDLRATGLPAPDGDVRPLAAWVREESLAPFENGLSGDRFLATWEAHLETFASMEDVRIKVKKAAIRDGDPVRADADLKFAWLGRDRDGRRRWVKGKGRVGAERLQEHRWVLHSFEITELHSLIATAELFSEVSLPAGTALNVPAWGQPGNEVFTSHGVAVADVDNDGLLDAFVTGNHENYLYRNRGDGTFENRALEALVAVTPLATGPLFLDYDADGDADLFLATAGRQMLFENRFVPEGALFFEDVSEAAGVSLPAEGYSALAADVNSDGRPDIYVCSYNKYGQVMPNSWSDATNGTANLLFLNQGDGTFRESAAAWGCDDTRWTYAAMFADVNDDGRADLYVANDFGRNALYLNDGGRFRDATAEFGLTDPGNGMGVSFGDIDNDGDLDIHVTNMSSTAGNRILKMVFADGEGSPEYAGLLRKLASGNTLFRNTGDGYRDVSPEMGPFSAGWAFGGGFVDLDNDGWQDLHAPNGFISGKGLKDT